MKVPKLVVIRKQCQEIGRWDEYKEMREGLKATGVDARAAAEETYLTLGIGDEWAEWNQARKARETMGEVPVQEPAGSVPLKRMSGIPLGAKCGTEETSMAEQILWVKDAMADVRNGKDPPMQFPNKGTMYWYQEAVLHNAKYNDILKLFETSGRDEEESRKRDGAYQFDMIEGQIREALRETRDRLVEIEPQLSQAFNTLLPDGPEGASIESDVPA